MASCVAVVGAGVAGLYAAQCLRQRGVTNVIVLEAMPAAGGRVLPYTTPDGLVVDLGGEFIHGSQNNLLYDLALQQGWTMRHVFDYEDPKNKRQQAVVVNGSLLPYEHPVVTEVLDLREWLVQQTFSNDYEDTSVYQYLLAHHPGFSSAAYALLECYLGATYGSSLTVLGAQEVAADELGWCHGTETFVVEGGMRRLLDYLKDGVDIRSGWRVAAIDTSGPRVVVKGTKGQRLECDRVVVTVPLPVLQDGDITFTPELPRPKQAAIDALLMGQAGKVVCTFSCRFWSPDLNMLLTDNLLFPQIWMYLSDEGRGLYVVVGFITGPGLALADLQPREGIVRLFVQYLDIIFKAHGPKAASGSLVRGMVHSWARHPTVRGAYCCPRVGSRGARETLAAAVGRRLFFAGEAANHKSTSNLHSAMESGLTAADAVVASLRDSKL